MMLPPTVNIDGTAIRRIRETNKLTQFYVAKVVGVTPDTISRWENNRYPSIKRENVLRLAEALETEVENILRQPEPDAASQLDPAKKPVSWLMPAIIVLVLLIGGGLFLVGRKPVQNRILGERILPIFAAPGAIIPVWLDIDPAMSRKGYIIREKFPVGWKLTEATPPPSSLDNVEGVARWIVKPGEERLKVAYLVKVADQEKLGVNREFFGEIVAKDDVQSYPARIGGFVSVTVAPYVWADINGDRIVDDSEMLQASDSFDEMQGVHLEWNVLEKIWDAGGYHWDQEHHRFTPERHPAQAP